MSITPDSEKTLRYIIEKQNNHVLIELLALNDALTHLSGALRLTYKDGIQNNDWKAYNTLKEIKLNYIEKIKQLEKEL